MSKADMLGDSPTFNAVAQPMSNRAASFARFSGQDNPATPSAPAQGGTRRLSLDVLAHNPYNPREELKAVDDLADSLTARGLIQPLTVVTRQAFLTAHPDHEDQIGRAEYVVVDGNRRLAASKIAGLDDVPVHLDDSLAEDADRLLETALTAAVQHENLDPLDEAKALQRLVHVHGSQRAVARALGKSSPWVTQRLALLKLTPELQEAVENRTLPVEIARNVGQLPEQQQESAAEAALAKRAAAKEKGKHRAPGANGVSTPSQARPSQPLAPPTGGANGVSTPKTDPTAVPETGLLAAAESKTGNEIEADTAVGEISWKDGNAVMDLALTMLSPDQRTAFLHRYIQRSGSTEALLADLSRDLPQEKRNQLADILGAVAERLRSF